MEGFEMNVEIDLDNVNIILSKCVIVNGRKYIVDGSKVVFDQNKKEIHMALWLSQKLNKKIELLPRILQPENIQTSDYMIEGEYWDLKGIVSNKNYAVYSRLRNQNKQASNFIIDISKSKLTIKSVIYQVKELYKLKSFKKIKKILNAANKATTSNSYTYYMQ